MVFLYHGKPVPSETVLRAVLFICASGSDRQTQTGTERGRTQTDTSRYTQAQNDTARHRLTQTDAGRQRQAFTDTEQHETQTERQTAVNSVANEALSDGFVL